MISDLGNLLREMDAADGTFLTSKRLLPSSLPAFFLAAAAAGGGVSTSIADIFERDLGVLRVGGGLVAVDSKPWVAKQQPSLLSEFSSGQGQTNEPETISRKFKDAYYVQSHRGVHSQVMPSKPSFSPRSKFVRATMG